VHGQPLPYGKANQGLAEQEGLSSASANKRGGRNNVPEYPDPRGLPTTAPLHGFRWNATRYGPTERPAKAFGTICPSI